MAIENTGYQAWTKLKKVVDGGSHDGEALDDNNYLVASSGAPQSKKDNNVSDPDYVPPILNEADCPLPTP
jgi:hypothetical protein